MFLFFKIVLISLNKSVVVIGFFIITNTPSYTKREVPLSLTETLPFALYFLIKLQIHVADNYDLHKLLPELIQIQFCFF